jgi:signal transduction histidine kinase
MPESSALWNVNQSIQIVSACRSRDEWLSGNLRQILDTIPVLVFVAEDVACTSMFGNAAVEALYRAPSGANVSKSCPDAVAPQAFEVFDIGGLPIPNDDLPMQRAAARGETMMGAQMELRFNDGERVWLYGNARPLYDENGIVWGSVGSFVDISFQKRLEQDLLAKIAECKQAEEAARKSEERFSTLVMASSDVVYRMSPDWREMRHLLGQNFIADTVAPNRTWDQDYIHPDDQPHVWAVINEAIRTKSTFELEHRVLRVDGSLGWTFSRAIPILDDNGEIIEWLGTASDVSERKLEAERLQQAKSEADRTSLTRSKFLAAASHDLRQPVQSLVLLLSALKNPQASKKQIAKAVGMMEAALEGLNTLLTSILDVSRIDAGVVIPQMHNTDVGALLHRLRDEYAPQCEQKDLRLRCRCNKGLHARTDAPILERILRNLIENAIRYTDRGGLLIGSRRRGDRLRIDIVDTGIGIPADKLAHIFEEFYQVGNPARNYQQGLGLGLSIVSRLAGLIGSDVQVRSREGRGTFFTVTVPLDAAVHKVSVPSYTPEFVTGRRIMVIEDNDKVRAGLELMLEGWNCEILGTESGEEALKAGELDGWCFDAIIADHRLGAGMSGTETAVEIRARAGRPIPTLIVTGDTAPERISEVHASGFEMMHKPVTPDELARKMAQLLRGGGTADDSA